MANRIHIEVQKKRGARIDYPKSVSKPSVFPSFVLVFDQGWNDYSIRTLFHLYFYDEDEGIYPIGEVKLMSFGVRNTIDVLQESFDDPLDSKFCSLGQSPEYYQTLHNLFSDTPDILAELMTHLRDCAYSPKIREQFNADVIFNTSLIRDLNAEKALRLGKFLLNGIFPDKAYSFIYKFCPPDIQRFNYSWDVNFKYDIPGFARTKCLIGENGVGKTLLLANLARDLVTGDKDKFKPNVPLFGSCLSICSTPLDRFDFGKQGFKIQYQNCSLSQERDTDGKLISLLETILQRPTVKKTSMREKFLELLSDFLPHGVCKSLFNTEIKEEEPHYYVNKEAVKEITTILSSGQLHELMLISNICAFIHFSTLLIIDEPEVHLHPRFIMRFMEVLCSILDTFESYAIIATHSPLVVREVLRDNVFLISEKQLRDVNNDVVVFSEIGKANFSTFGEDVSKLHFDVFHYDESESLFYRIAKKTAINIHQDEAMLNCSEVSEKVIRYFERYQKLSLNGIMVIQEVVDNVCNAQ